MDWQAAAGFGAAGGAVVEVIVLFGNLTAWQSARSAARDHRSAPPSLARFIDLPADIPVAVTRLLLGALAGLLFHDQVTGTMAAVAVGASAPALLRQLGRATTVQEIIAGEKEPHPRNPPPVSPDPSPVRAESLAGPDRTLE